MDDFSLLQTTIEITRIVVPIIIIFGTLGNILNILILTRQHLRGYACSMYFIALSVVCLFYTSVLLINNLLLDGYSIDLAKYSNVACKLISYLLNVCPLLAAFYIVLASIDRYCASSLDAGRRRFSQKNVAKLSVLMVTMIISIIMLGSVIAFDLRDDGAGCTSRSDSLFNQVFLFLETILYAIIAPCLLIIFGSLTIVNSSRLVQNRAGVSRHRRTEKELARMLIVQVATQVLLSAPFCAVFVTLVIPTDFRFTLKFYIIFVLSKIPIYLTYLSPFFLYILSARIYREELIQLFKKLFRIRTNNRGHHQTTVAPAPSLLP